MVISEPDGRSVARPHSPPLSLSLSLSRCLSFSYAAITAGLELLPEGLDLAQLHLVEGDRHLADGVVPAEAVVVQHLQVERPLPHLLIGEAWRRENGTMITGGGRHQPLNVGKCGNLIKNWIKI